MGGRQGAENSGEKERGGGEKSSRWEFLKAGN